MMSFRLNIVIPGEVVLGIDVGAFNPLLLVTGRDGDGVLLMGVVLVVGFLRAEVLEDVMPAVLGFVGRLSLGLLAGSALLDAINVIGTKAYTGTA